MYEEGEECFYYLTVENETYERRGMPGETGEERVRDGILKGMYLLEEVPEEIGEEAPRVHLFGSSAILREALRARELLRERRVGPTVWSVTSYVEMRHEALGVERWNRLHLGEESRVPWITEQLAERPWPVVAASDDMELELATDGADPATA